jgi:hypothetical protein
MTEHRRSEQAEPAPSELDPSGMALLSGNLAKVVSTGAGGAGG